MELVATAVYVYVLMAFAISACAITLSHAKVSSGLRKWLNEHAPLFGSLLSCPYCVSHWLAFILMFLYPLPLVADPFLNWFLGSMSLVGLAAIFSGIAMNVLHIHEDTIDALREALKETRDELAACQNETAPDIAADADAAPAWQTIETAPKDGTRILIHGTQTYLGVKDWVSTAEWVELGSAPGAGYFNTHDQQAMGKASHWMPLPAAPLPGGDDNE